MRSPKSRPGSRHASAAPTAASLDRPRGVRIARGVAHGTLLLGLVSMTLTYAAPSSPSTDEPAPIPAVESASPAPSSDSFPHPASRSEVRPALERDVAISADGTTRALVTDAETVGEILDEAGLVLGTEDQVDIGMTEVPTDGETIGVARVTYTQATEVTEIPFETSERRDSTLASGTREVDVAGAVGQQTVVYTIRLVDGVEVSREETLRTVIAPVTQVVRIGTMVATPVVATPSVPGLVSGPVYSGDPRSIGRAMVAARGWGDDQWACLDALFTRESNWNPLAQNASSGAYGIPQSLPGSKMATVAADWRTNPATQITWGLNYIAGRYGTPCGAWAHSQSTGWY